MLIAVVVSLPLGIYTAIHQNTWKDTAGMVFALFGTSMPNFWLGLMLIIIFALKLGLLPSGGKSGFSSIILPAVTVGFGLAALITRTTRSSMLDTINQDYIRTSKARGVSKFKIIMSHTLKNALIPILTAIGLRFGQLLAGAALVETVFSIPGLGRFMVDGISNRDYPVIQSTVLLFATTFVVVNTLVDLLYGFVDPRVKYN